MIRRAALLVFAGCLVAWPGTATASDVTASEFQDLVESAADDPAAVEELREVETVDGRPVDLPRVVDDASDQELRRRLRALASRTGASGTENETPASDPRAQAREILGDESFEDDERIPRPLKGVADWISDALDPVGDFFEDLADAFPGGASLMWVVLALVVGGLAYAFTRRRLHRWTGSAPATAHFGGTRSVTELEREAEEAKRAGDHDAVVRLLFLAGLLRLNEAGVIRFRPSMTSREVSRALRSPVFDALAATFDAVAYGGQRALAGDVEEATAGWARLRGEVKAA